jgi:hypothetical protein
MAMSGSGGCVGSPCRRPFADGHLPSQTVRATCARSYFIVRPQGCAEECSRRPARRPPSVWSSSGAGGPWSPPARTPGRKRQGPGTRLPHVTFSTATRRPTAGPTFPRVPPTRGTLASTPARPSTARASLAEDWGTTAALRASTRAAPRDCTAAWSIPIPTPTTKSPSAKLAAARGSRAARAAPSVPKGSSATSTATVAVRAARPGRSAARAMAAAPPARRGSSATST